MRGFPAWPAKVVEQRSDGKYAVIFFGTMETANVQPTDIWSYDTPNTNKFCTDKTLKRPLFMEGMEQLKQALAKKGNRAAYSLEHEEADMVKVGRSESKEAAEVFQSSEALLMSTPPLQLETEEPLFEEESPYFENSPEASKTYFSTAKTSGGAQKKKQKMSDKKLERSYMSPGEESSTESEDSLSAVQMGLVKMQRNKARNRLWQLEHDWDEDELEVSFLERKKASRSVRLGESALLSIGSKEQSIESRHSSDEEGAADIQTSNPLVDKSSHSSLLGEGASKVNKWLNLSLDFLSFQGLKPNLGHT